MSWVPWDSFSQFFFWHIVQVSMVALVVWPIASFTSRRNAHISHLLWVLVLIKCLTPPVLALPTSPFCWLDQGNSYHAIVASSDIPTHPSTKIPQQRQTSRSQQPQATAVSKSSTQSGESPLENGRASLRLNFGVVDEATNPAAALNDQSLGNGKAGLVASSTTSTPKSHMKRSAGSSVRISDTTTTFATLIIRGLSLLCLMGVFLTATTGVFNWLRLRREIKRGTTPEPLRQQVEVLRKRLGVRRTVCLKVLPQQFGPAVTGIFRPTVLLPQSIVNVLNPAELEAVIAHELIHFRRGDIAWAALQFASRCVFWFHPLVRMAIRQVTLESERCCDEQTVAAINCTPQQYALSLLKVVEHQANSRPFALLPSVRPIDITKNRLERIMNFKDEMKQQTPLCAWAILLLGALVTLPGAAWVSAQSPPDPQRKRNLIAAPEQSTIPAKVQPVYVKAYDVTELKRKSQEAWAAERKSKNDPLVDTATSLLMKFPPSSEKSVSCLFSDYVTTDESHPHEKTVIKLGGDQPMAQLIGDHLFLLADQEYHQFAKNYVADRSVHGFDQMIFSAEFIRLPRELLDAQDLDWKFLQNAQDSETTTPISTPSYGSFEEIFPRTTVGLQASTSDHSKVYLAIVDDRQLEELRNNITVENGAIGRQGPNITCFFGSPARIANTNTRPFVVGLRPRTEAGSNSEVQPIIKLFEVGTSLDVRGVAAEDEAIEINCSLKHSAINEVEVEQALVKATDGSPFQLQNPKVETVQIHLTQRVPKGCSLLVASSMADTPGQMRMLLLRCDRIYPRKEQKPPTKTALNSNKALASRFPWSSKEHPFDPPKVPSPTKLVMTAAKNAKADRGDPAADNWPIIALMKNVGFDPEISGRFELKVESGVVTVSGKDITLEIGKDKISAESGQLTFNENELSELIFRGKATIKDHSGTVFSADKIELKREEAGSGEFQFLKFFNRSHFEGNFRCGDTEEQLFASDRATFDARQTLLDGNAIMQCIDEESRQIFEGNSVRMAYDEDVFQIRGKGKLTIGKDKLLQTIVGENISFNSYRSGMVVDGKSVEVNPAFHELN